MTTFPKYNSLSLTCPTDAKICQLTFTRPERYNSMEPRVYAEILDALRYLESAESVHIVIVTGEGKFFSSGLDLAWSPKATDLSLEESLVRDVGITKTLVDVLITFPKILIAAVNGPALGFACSMLALFDFVYSVEDAWFETPFMKLALCAEACSSITFPRIMGTQKASEMLLLNRRFSANELQSLNFINALYPSPAILLESVHALASKISQLSPSAVWATKKLIRQPVREELIACNKREMELLVRRMMSKEFATVLAGFKATKKSRL